MARPAKPNPATSDALAASSSAAAPRKAAGPPPAPAPRPAPPPPPPAAPAAGPVAGVAPRPTVVLRAGPRRKAAWRDGAVGALGVLLLILSGLFVAILPEPDVVLPQFSVNIVAGSVAYERSEIFVLDAANPEHTISIVVGDEDVTGFSAELFLLDDQPASLPDTVLVELIAPDGHGFGTAQTGANPMPSVAGDPFDPTRPTLDPLNPDSPVRVVASAGRPKMIWSLNPAPEPAVATGVRPDETAEEVAVRLQQANHRDASGEWRLRVKLLSVGGCPQANHEDPQSIHLKAACEHAKERDRAAGGTGAEDSGNPVTIELFQYSTFALDVQPLKDEVA